MPTKARQEQKHRFRPLARLSPAKIVRSPVDAGRVSCHHLTMPSQPRATKPARESKHVTPAGVVTMSDKPNNQDDEDDVPDTEAEYVDFSSPSILRAALKKAFDEEAKKNKAQGGPVPMDGRPREKKTPGKRGLRDRFTKRRPWEPEIIRTKFCFDRTIKLLGCLQKGMWMEQACDVCGVRSFTVSGWIKRGEKEESGPYYVFSRGFHQISAAFESTHLSNITAQMPRMKAEASADMSLKMLSIKFPDRWGGRKQVDITSGGEKLPSQADPISEIVFKFVDADTATPVDVVTSAVAHDEEQQD